MTWIALLRGINVGGHNKIPMTDLRSLCTRLGWGGVRSYIQSGNLVLDATGEKRRLEQDLARAIEDSFGFPVTVMVRSAAEWDGMVKSNPFPEESGREPNHVLVALPGDAIQGDAASSLSNHARDGEVVREAAECLWIYYPGGQSQSRLTPAVMARAAGSPITARNWRTVVKLREMASESPS